jgi:fluoride exporter
MVAAGGALGTVARYMLGVMVPHRLGWGPPWATTFFINVVGSFAIGLVAELAIVRVAWMGPELRLFLAVGVLGGFTTFSTFSLELVGLMGQRSFAPALGYALGSLVLGFAAAFCGLLLARTVAA